MIAAFPIMPIVWVALILFIVGIYLRSIIIFLLTSLLLMGIAVYILIYGYGNFLNFPTEALGIVLFGVGAYLGIRSSVELIGS